MKKQSVKLGIVESNRLCEALGIETDITGKITVTFAGPDITVLLELPAGTLSNVLSKTLAIEEGNEN